MIIECVVLFQLLVDLTIARQTHVVPRTFPVKLANPRNRQDVRAGQKLRSVNLVKAVRKERQLACHVAFLE